LIHRVNIFYSTDGETWIAYKNDEELSTGQIPQDNHLIRREINFAPKIRAKKVRVAIKPRNCSDVNVHGRFDFLVRKI
tara:strand:- start:109 stop:342 length:234 start_codon:yes stop_codon:yes gene_type:complete